MGKNYLPVQEMQEPWVQSLGREEPLEESMEPTSVFLLGKSHGQRNLVGNSTEGHKDSDMTEVTRLSLSLSLSLYIYIYYIYLSIYNIYTFSYSFILLFITGY